MPSHGKGKYIFDGDVQEYDDRFLICRDIGHHWIPSPHWDVSYKGKRIIEYRRTVLCENCDCQRIDVYDGQMRIASRHYKHSNGYILGREVTLTPSSARLEQIRRHGLDAPKVGKRRRRPLRAV